MGKQQYHINPSTHEVGLCHANIQCKFGEHYETAEQASVTFNPDFLQGVKRKTSRKVVVALDLDNSVVDFTGGLRDFLARKEKLSPREAMLKYPDPTDYNLSKGKHPWFDNIQDFLTAINEAETNGLYRNLEARAGAITVIKKLLKDERIDLRVVTARSKKYNSDTQKSLEQYGLNLPIENIENKEDYDAHIFVDDKDSFVEKIRSGEYVASDGTVKTVIVPANRYNLHLEAIRTWDNIGTRLNETVERIFENGRREQTTHQ